MDRAGASEEEAPDGWKEAVAGLPAGSGSGSTREQVILQRLEEVALVMLGVCGTIAIAWGCLVLDHLTRHHFSRRLQALALLVWAALSALVLWVLVRIILGD